MENEQANGTYMDFVLARRARNMQRLQDLGLDGPLLAGSSPPPRCAGRSSRVTVTVTPPRRRSQSSKHSTPLRRSDRVQGVKAKVRIVPDDVPVTRVLAQKKKKHVGNQSESSQLTEQDRQRLRLSETWLDDMTDYLTEVEKLSPQNLRSVMRQVEKLVSGSGVTYQHWAPGVVFRCKVTLQHDFHELHTQAADFESRHGKDRGHGWLLSHPIKKLANYQLYLIESQKNPMD